MSEINKTLTVEALEESVEEEIDAEGSAFITIPELEDVMEGYDVGVETGGQLVDRLAGEHGWAYQSRGDGFEIARERWKLGGESADPQNEDARDPSNYEDMW